MERAGQRRLGGLAGRGSFALEFEDEVYGLLRESAVGRELAADD